jgi:hypothetical protein
VTIPPFDIDIKALLVWTVVSFVLWLALMATRRLFHVPHWPVFAAVLSWVIARLFLWLAPVAATHVHFWLATSDAGSGPARGAPRDRVSPTGSSCPVRRGGPGRLRRNMPGR